MTELNGKLVKLRAPTPKDYPAFQKILSDPKTMDELLYMAHLDAGGWTLEQVAKRYEDRTKERGQDTGLDFAICDAMGQVIGDCGFKHIDRDHKRAEFGIILHHAYWGKGIAQDCFVTCLDYAFQQLKLHRIEMSTFATNVRSRKVLENLGVHQEGSRRDCFYSGGCYKDDVIYGILEQDWPKIRKQMDL